MSIGIGILGLAHAHVGMYAQQWKQMPATQVRLVSCWDHDGQRGVDTGASLELPVDRSVQALLDRSDIDAVVIGAETSLHAELAEQAAAAGKAIILQKPMALTMQQADRIVAAVEKHRIKFTLAWQMRNDPQNLKMRELVREGTVGRVLQVRRRHCLNTQVWGTAFAQSWHVKPELNRGMWADDAAHAIDWTYWMFGRPQTVFADIATLLNPKVPDDHGVAVFRYADGLMAEVSCSFTQVAGENTTEIVGEKGVIIQNYGDLVSCNSPRSAEAPGLRWYVHPQSKWIDSGIPSPASHGQRINGLALPLLEYLQDKRPAIATAQEGRDVLRMTLACYQSAQTGQRTDINQTH